MNVEKLQVGNVSYSMKYRRLAKRFVQIVKKKGAKAASAWARIALPDSEERELLRPFVHEEFKKTGLLKDWT